LARAAGRPIIAAYHCDVILPPGLFNLVVQAGVGLADRLAARRIDRIVAYTHDYARHSRLLRDYADQILVIPPPICVKPIDPLRVQALRPKAQPGAVSPHVIGFAARLAAEKGIEHLLAALPIVEAAIGPVRLLIAGECDGVIGEEACRAGLAPLIRAQGERLQLLGVLPQEAMPNFYAACDVTVLPSTNATESFGMVQVESMLCGTPVVASDLPGVRVPVQMTGMGRIVPAANPAALAEALIEVLRRLDHYRKPRLEIETHFHLECTVLAYEKLFGQLVGHRPYRPRPVVAGVVAYSSHRPYLRDHLREVPAFRALLRSVECLLLEQAGPLRQPVLDLGCGDGHFASMAFTGPLLAGIDPDAAALREADRRGVYRHAVQGDATRLPFADESFQTVLANSSLEHIPAMDAALAEAVRVLQPGGRLILTTPSAHFATMLLGSSLLRRLGLERAGRAYGHWFNRHSRHYHTDSLERWQRRLEQLGLSVEHGQYYFTPPAHRAFDLAHYLGLPRLLSHRLTGCWMPMRSPVINVLFERWLRRHLDTSPQVAGPYLFFVARRN
jgi:SAM-dependent methyltransferase